MNFKYRYVGYGTVFKRAEGLRDRVGRSEEDPFAPSRLFANELVVDVGGVCWGYEGEESPIIDHHFRREKGGQFPSAAAAVLHNAVRIHERFKDCNGILWLVTHDQPDFDAYCAAYLARCILEGAIPAEGWETFGVRPEGWFPEEKKSEKKSIDWFKPRLDGLPPERRWPILLAAYAACVDNCKRLSCPKERALHSVLYAAMRRGRDFGSTGAVEFFNEARAAMEKGLNPLCDSLFDEQSTFAPELDMLKRELLVYERDIKRARRTIVNVPKAAVPFEKWFGQVSRIPLLSSDLHIQSPHLETAQDRRQVDGIYIRDPECVLFKEWARMDTENSSMGEGFIFTAVAYSNDKASNPVNTTDYYFSLDPERSRGCHLYSVWALLQAKEIEILQHSDRPEVVALREDLKKKEKDAAKDHASDPTKRGTICRLHFEERAAALKPLFDDPWFDGHNYKCTIVVTANRGTYIGPPGTQGDLSDDPVARIVQEELEFSFFHPGSAVEVVDFAASTNGQDLDLPQKAVSISDALRTIEPPRDRYYRFCKVVLHKDVNVMRPQMAQQIGKLLWELLEGDSPLHPDFAQRHLLMSHHWVGVWTRHGAAVAHKQTAQQEAENLESIFQEIAGISKEIDRYIDSKPETEEIVEEGQALLRRVANLQHQLLLPENRLAARFFEATRLSELLETVSDLNEAEVEREQTRKTTRLGKIVTFLGSVMGFPAMLLAYLDAVSEAKALWFGIEWDFKGNLVHAAIATGVAFIAGIVVFVCFWFLIGRRTRKPKPRTERIGVRKN
jgi:hypothetical protein